MKPPLCLWRAAQARIWPVFGLLALAAVGLAGCKPADQKSSAPAADNTAPPAAAYPPASAPEAPASKP